MKYYKNKIIILFYLLLIFCSNFSYDSKIISFSDFSYSINCLPLSPSKITETKALLNKSYPSKPFFDLIKLSISVAPSHSKKVLNRVIDSNKTFALVCTSKYNFEFKIFQYSARHYYSTPPRAPPISII